MSQAIYLGINQNKDVFLNPRTRKIFEGTAVSFMDLTFPMSDISHVEYSDLTQNLYASPLPLVLLDDNLEENTTIEGECATLDSEVATSVEDEAVIIPKPESAIEGEDAMEDSQSEISTIEEPEAEVITQPEQHPSHAAA
ncbi:hypothetical protein LPJ77_005220 [Coemansia sp. RSA 2523]|nr:hypothetical protein LPJ54_005020 [Coemansia sp. RSA 1824]KAJ1803504.1 hypothetical protein LPJ77_005220 [Coemansia sp. RSA 2523]